MIGLITLYVFSQRFIPLYAQTINKEKLDRGISDFRMKSRDIRSRFDYRNYNRQSTSPIKWKKLIQVMRENYHHKYFIIFLMTTFMTTLTALHVEIKMMVHLFWVGDDEERLKYCDDIYYSSMTRPSKHPAAFNKLYFCLATVNLLFWYDNLRFLLWYTLTNKDNYTEVSISQVNFAYLMTFRGSIMENVTKMFKVIFLIYKYRSNRERYLKYYEDYDEEHLDHALASMCQMSFRTLVIRNNLMNFTKHYRDFLLYSEVKEEYLFPMDVRPITDGETPDHFCQKPFHRQGIFYLWLGILNVHICFLITMSYLISFGVAYFLIEMSDGNEELNNLRETFSRKVVSAEAWLRSLDYVAMGSIFLAIHQTVYSFAWDSVNLLSRTKRVEHLIGIELKRLRSLRLLSSNSPEDMQLCKFQGDSEAERRVHHLVLLVRLVKYEFVDLKSQHSFLLNLVIVGYSICIPQSVSLMIFSPYWVEKMASLISALANISPVVLILIYASLIERAVSRDL